MDMNDIVVMCERLSRKFNRPQHYEDMVSEGVLKVYDLLDKDPKTHPASLYREAKRRMYDYLNFDCNGLSLPASDAARAVARGNDTSEREDYSQRGLERLRKVLTSEWYELEDDIVGADHMTPEDILIDKEVSQKLTNFISTVLTNDEAELIILRYFEDATQDEVSDIFGLTRQGVSLREKKALRKLKFQVCNIL